jgi:O-antigen/teichoic acid export membrane protein
MMMYRERFLNAVQVLSGKGGKGTLKSHLLRGSVGSFALKIFSTGLVFFYGVLLARLLGVADYGTYEYVIAWMTILVVPAINGMDKVLLRSLASYQTQSEWGLMHGVLRWSYRVVLGFAIVMALLAASGQWLLSGMTISPSLVAFWVGCLFIPLTALVFITEGSLRGLHHVITGQMPVLLIRPAAAILLVVGAYVVFGDQLDAIGALGLYMVASSIALIFGLIMLWRRIPAEVKQATPQIDWRPWLLGGLPLTVITALTLTNTRLGVLFLEPMQGAAAAGIFAVVIKGGELITFTLIAADVAIAPTFASLYAKGDMQRLQRVVTQGSRLVFLGTLPFVLGIILFREQFLMIFGPAFVQAELALIIVCIGQLVRSLMGTVGTLLIMTNHGRDAALVMVITVVISLGLHTVLIPEWGLEGAAVATAVGTSIWNILMAILVYKRLGIHTTVLGEIRLWGRK